MRKASRITDFSDRERLEFRKILRCLHLTPHSPSCGLGLKKWCKLIGWLRNALDVIFPRVNIMNISQTPLREKSLLNASIRSVPVSNLLINPRTPHTRRPQSRRLPARAAAFPSQHLDHLISTSPVPSSIRRASYLYSNCLIPL